MYIAFFFFDLMHKEIPRQLIYYLVLAAFDRLNSHSESLKPCFISPWFD